MIGVYRLIEKNGWSFQLLDNITLDTDHLFFPFLHLNVKQITGIVAKETVLKAVQGGLVVDSGP
jgi:hypothetical protein